MKKAFYLFVINPHEAGIDPLSYLADRVPADNLKRVSL
jgi:ABC-2 type transport system permease protein